MCTHYKVVFADELMWIVRVSKPGRSMYMEEKEVAVIIYFTSNTTIPVPGIIAFGAAEDNVAGFSSFMVFLIGGNLGMKLFDRNLD